MLVNPDRSSTRSTCAWMAARRRSPPCCRASFTAPSSERSPALLVYSSDAQSATSLTEPSLTRSENARIRSSAVRPSTFPRMPTTVIPSALRTSSSMVPSACALLRLALDEGQDVAGRRIGDIAHLVEQLLYQIPAESAGPSMLDVAREVRFRRRRRVERRRAVANLERDAVVVVLCDHLDRAGGPAAVPVVDEVDAHFLDGEPQRVLDLGVRIEVRAHLVDE